jgi:hypothetical protein
MKWLGSQGDGCAAPAGPPAAERDCNEPVRPCRASICCAPFDWTVELASGTPAPALTLWFVMQNLNFELATTLEHLELAQWHVASGSRLIRRQREMLLHLERDREPVVEAKMRLLEFEQSQLARIAHRDRIAATLAAIASRRVQ